MSIMKVLTVSLDVTALSEQEISDLQFAMEVQSEDFPHAVIINSGTKDLDVDTLEDYSDDFKDIRDEDRSYKTIGQFDDDDSDGNLH